VAEREEVVDGGLDTVGGRGLVLAEAWPVFKAEEVGKKVACKVVSDVDMHGHIVLVSATMDVTVSTSQLPLCNR
jgi:hypothetical protein